MKKFVLSLAVIVSSAGYVLYQYFGSAASAAPSASVILQTRSQPLLDSSQSSSQQTVSNTNLPPATKPRGQYADGTYTGAPADAYYGTVQVRAIVSGGKLTNVAFLQYPNTHGTSVYINQQAMPYLTEEALRAQNANVDIVSGATFTSQAFQQSLASALSQGKSG